MNANLLCHQTGEHISHCMQAKLIFRKCVLKYLQTENVSYCHKCLNRPGFGMIP